MAHATNYSEELGYVDIYGQDVKAYICEKTGRILIPIDAVRRAGFQLFKKSQYSKLLVDDSQFTKEFDLHLLQCAQNYLLERRVVFKENEILECINNCKRSLAGRKPLDNFIANHVVKTEDENITITASAASPLSTLREPSAATLQSLHNDGKISRFTSDKNSFSSTQFDFKRNEPKISPKEARNEWTSSASSTQFDPKWNQPKFSPKESRNDWANSEENGLEQRKSFTPKANPRQSNQGRNTCDGRKSGSNQNGQPRRDFEQRERLKNIELNNLEHKVVVTSIDKSNVVWVQDQDQADVLLEIDTKVQEELKHAQKPTRLIYNQIYLAPDEGSWYRCKVIKFKPTTAFFVDYGNTVETSDFKEVSEELAKIPAQAAKITFNDRQYSPNMFDKITIRIKERFENETYLVDIIKVGDDDRKVPFEIKTSPHTKAEPKTSPFSKSEPPETRASPLAQSSRPETNASAFSKSPSQVKNPTAFLGKPVDLCKLQNGQRVMISDHVEGHLGLRTKECYDKLRDIETALESLGSVTALQTVERGQLVLWEKDKLQRAIVVDVQRNSVEIELLDYYKKMKVDMSSLRNINESLAKEPITFVKTPQLKGYSGVADGILKDLIDKRSKATVVLLNGDFDLKIGEELLSNKLEPQQDSSRPLINEFEAYKPPLGVGKYMLNVYRDRDNVFFSSEDVVQEHLGEVVMLELDDENPYEPIVGEVCLGYYQDSWCRCVVKGAMNLNYQVEFIDFGNMEFFKSDQLRKLNDGSKNTPIIAFRCKLVGLPPVKNVDDQLKEHATPEEYFEINIKKCNGNFYEIEMPSVYKLLK